MAENTTPSKKTFAERAAAEPTDLHKQFADWLKEKTGVDVDLKTVQLVTVMRMDFQRSEENQASLKDRKAKAEAEAKKKAEARKAKLLAELAKLEGGTVEEAKTEEPAKADDEVDPSATPAGPAPDGLGAKEDGEPTEPVKPQRKPRVRRTAAK